MLWGGCKLKECTHLPKAILSAFGLDPTSLQLECVMHSSLWSGTHAHGGGKGDAKEKRMQNTKAKGIQGGTREKAQQHQMEGELTCVFLALQMIE